MDPQPQQESQEQIVQSPEPRWPAIVTLLIACGLYAELDISLALGPRWLLVSIVAALIIPNLITHRWKRHTINNVLGFITEGVVTVFLLGSVIALVRSLPGKKIEPLQLLQSAAILWICNVVLFALWYWRLDAGGPYARFKRGRHVNGAFLFPQMTNDGGRMIDKPWSPMFVDYLFLSFNTSTALSPTDAPIISRWAKMLMMLQALISLTLVVVLTARAVNLL